MQRKPVVRVAYVIGEGGIPDMGFTGGEEYFIEIGVTCTHK